MNKKADQMAQPHRRGARPLRLRLRHLRVGAAPEAQPGSLPPSTPSSRCSSSPTSSQATTSSPKAARGIAHEPARREASSDRRHHRRVCAGAVPRHRAAHGRRRCRHAVLPGGELFQSYAVGKSRKSIADMMDIAPEFANVMKDGELQQVDPAELSVGDEFKVLPASVSRSTASS